MKARFFPLIKKEASFLLQMRIPYRQDKNIQSLLRINLFVILFVVMISIGYTCLLNLLVPYYESTQHLNQQIQVANELKDIPEQNPDRWQQFEKETPSFSLTNMKIKAVFYSLCQLYRTHLKTGTIQEILTQSSLSFKPGRFTLTAPTDKQILGFLHHVIRKLPGVLVIKMVRLHRKVDIDAKLLAEIKLEKESIDLVEASIEFEWFVF